MPDVLDLFDSLFDVLALCAGLVVILWVVLHSFRRRRATALPPAVVIGMLAWLAVFGFALYLIFG
jgi:hypothetical protein